MWFLQEEGVTSKAVAETGDRRKIKESDFFGLEALYFHLKTFVET